MDGTCKICGKELEKDNNRNICYECDAKIRNLVNRMNICLEDSEWEKADLCSEKILELDSENAEAYLGKLQIEFHVSKLIDFSEINDSFELSNNYKHFLSYSKNKLSSDMEKYVLEKNKRNEIIIKEESKKKGKKKKIRNTIILSFAYLVAIVIIIAIIIPSLNYQKADKLFQQQKYNEAAEVYEDLGNYKDSSHLEMESKYLYSKQLINNKEYSKAIEVLKEINTYRDSKMQIENAEIGLLDYPSVGSIVKFGKIDLANDTKSIEWIIIKTEKKKALLLSRYCITCRKYNENNTSSTTWERCSLRNWLNNDFYNSAFNNTEREKIILSNISAPDNVYTNRHNQKITVDGGLDTKDKVFLLTESESQKYDLPEVQQIKVYLEDNKKYSSSFIDEDGSIIWWTRTPGWYSDSVKYGGKGEVKSNIGMKVENKLGVRPAIWITIGN